MQRQAVAGTKHWTQRDGGRRRVRGIRSDLHVRRGHMRVLVQVVSTFSISLWTGGKGLRGKKDADFNEIRDIRGENFFASGVNRSQLASLSEWDIYFGDRTGLGGLDDGGDFANVALNEPPLWITEHHDGYCASFVVGACRDQKVCACTGVRSAAGASRLRAANSSTATTCSHVTSNHAITSSIVAPDSRFSKTVDTGIRVSLKTHAPPRRSGKLSTAGHFDQSRVAIVCAPRSGYRESHA